MSERPTMSEQPVMSERVQRTHSHQCNYCTMEGFKALSLKTGGALIVIDAPLLGLPNSVAAKEIYIHYKGDTKATWCGWLMSIPDHCCCGCCGR